MPKECFFEAGILALQARPVLFQYSKIEGRKFIVREMARAKFSFFTKGKSFASASSTLQSPSLICRGDVVLNTMPEARAAIKKLRA